jgi:ADP-ribose pyrophosphatase YjhB (NUDIX family)
MRHNTANDELEFQKHFLETRRELDPQGVTRSLTEEIALHEAERRQDRANGVDVAENPKVTVLKSFFMRENGVPLDDQVVTCLAYRDSRESMALHRYVRVRVRQAGGVYADWARPIPRRLRARVAPVFDKVKELANDLPFQQAIGAFVVLTHGRSEISLARGRGVSKQAISKNVLVALTKLAKMVPLTEVNEASLALSQYREELLKRGQHTINMEAVVEPPLPRPGESPRFPQHAQDYPWPLLHLVSEISCVTAQIYYGALLQITPEPIRQALEWLTGRGLSTAVRAPRLTPREAKILGWYMPRVEEIVRRRRITKRDLDLLSITGRPSSLPANCRLKCVPASEADEAEAAAYERIVKDWPAIFKRPPREWDSLLAASAKHGVADGYSHRIRKGWHGKKVTGEDALPLLIKQAGDVARIRTEASSYRGTIRAFSQNADGEMDGVEIMTAHGPVTVALADVREVYWPDSQAPAM